jgi:hypothetical protein
MEYRKRSIDWLDEGKPVESDNRNSIDLSIFLHPRALFARQWSVVI